jgi:hypothetical protein
MGTAAQLTRENRTITVDFRSEATYFQLLDDGKAFLEWVIAFVMSLGCQLKHKATCRGGGRLTRHSHYARSRLGGIALWRIQCTTCQAVFTVLPHFILRDRQMRPEVARNALLAAHGGLSLELCAVIEPISPMALYRLMCALGQQRLVAVLTRCGLPLPAYFLADEKHSRCRADKVYLPTIVSGRVIWHLGYTENASATALTPSYQECQRVAVDQEPTDRVRGMLTDGFDSTTKSVHTLFPGARLGNCLRHALTKLPGELTAIASPVRKALRAQVHTLLYRARQRQGLRVFALGQRWRRFANHVATTAGAANGTRVRQWFQEKKAGWYVVLEAPQMPVTSTLLDQAHHAINRKLFMMKAFHHPDGNQQAFLTGLALLDNFVPYQRRAMHAGPCGVEVEGGKVPTRDWWLNLQILTSGGSRWAVTHSTTKSAGLWNIRPSGEPHWASCLRENLTSRS